jgi:hypothetical protein
VSAQSFVATPLSDLKTGKYKGFLGGLYSNGSDLVPSDHSAAGLNFAAKVKPVNGKFVLLSIGMSNTKAEFKVFRQLARDNPNVNHTTLKVVNGAESGADACTWTVAFGSPQSAGCRNTSNQYDRVRDDLLDSLGLTEDQVEVVWVKEADVAPVIALPDSRADAFTYESYLGRIARAARQRYRNLKLMFISSRIYGGYATTKLNPEPFAYENGFAVKWAIQAQINQIRTGAIDAIAGDLNYTNGAAPWMVWGPYLWADGTKPRSDGLVWLRSDFGADGTHPSDAGATKVATMLLNFFLTSPYTAWFRVR